MRLTCLKPVVTAIVVTVEPGGLMLMLFVVDALLHHMTIPFQVTRQQPTTNIQVHQLVWREIASEPDSLGKFAGARQRF